MKNQNIILDIPINKHKVNRLGSDLDFSDIDDSSNLYTPTQNQLLKKHFISRPRNAIRDKYLRYKRHDYNIEKESSKKLMKHSIISFLKLDKEDVVSTDIFELNQVVFFSIETNKSFKTQDGLIEITKESFEKKKEINNNGLFL